MSAQEEAEPALVDQQRDRWAAVAACGLAVFVTAVDLNVVGVALPSLGGQFHAGPAATQWVILAYALPVVALLLPAGRWGDGADKRKAFVLAVLGFGVASALVAVSPSLPFMIGARALQAVFSALISALVLATIAMSVRSASMGRAVGAVASLGPLGGAIGPAAGGLLIDAVGWRAVFLINVPVCLVAAWLAWVSVPATDAGISAPRPAWLVDAGLLGVAGVTLLLGLQQLGGHGVAPLIGVALLALALVSGYAWLRRKDSRPVVELLSNPSVNRWLVTLLFGATVSGVLTFLVPFALTEAAGASNSVTGFTMLALSAGMVVFAPVGGVLTDRLGPRPVAIAGTALLLIGSAALVLVASGPHPLDVAWRLVLIGGGTGLLAAPAQAAVMISAPPDLGATTGALSALMLNLGFAVGPAAATLAWRLGGGGAFDTGAAFAVGAVSALLALLTVVTVRVAR